MAPSYNFDKEAYGLTSFLVPLHLIENLWFNFIFSNLTFNWKFAESSSKIPFGINHLLDNPKSGSDSKEFLLKVKFLECWSAFTCWSWLVCRNRLKKSWFPFQISDRSFSKSSQTLVKKGSSQKKPLRVCKKNEIEIIGAKVSCFWKQNSSWNYVCNSCKILLPSATLMISFIWIVLKMWLA